MPLRINLVRTIFINKTLNMHESRQCRPKVFFSTEFDVVATEVTKTRNGNHRSGANGTRGRQSKRLRLLDEGGQGRCPIRTEKMKGILTFVRRIHGHEMVITSEIATKSPIKFLSPTTRSKSVPQLPIFWSPAYASL